MDEDRSRGTDSLPLALVALAAASWGFVPILVRAVHSPPMVIAFWRVTLAALAFFAYFAARGRLGEARRIGRRTAAALSLLGALLGLGWLLFFSAIVFAPVAVAVLITFTAPLFVAAVSPSLTGDPFDRRIIVPLLIAFLGTVVIALPGGAGAAGGSAPERQLLGATLALGSAVVLALMTALQKRVLVRVPPDQMLFAQTVTAALFLFPVAMVFPGPEGGREWAALAALGFGFTTVPFLLFLSGLRRVRADRVAVVTYAEPVSAVLLAALFLHEPLTPATVVGGAAVVTGGFLVGRLSPAPGPKIPIP